MSSEFRTPYTPTPGGSLPSAETTPAEGRKELWTFFWLAVANTTIIAVAGVATWMLVPH
jgi:nitrate reductase NapE component